MKKRSLLLTGMLGLLAIPWAFASAACQDIQFTDGQKFCFDIQKLNADRFQARISSSNLKSLSELSCRLKLPNGNEVALPRCEGEFSYAGSDWRIELRADIQNYRYELVDTYSFRNGSFGASSSNTSPSYSNYQVEFTSTNPSNPARDQRVYVAVRVRGNGYSYSNYDKNIRFRVEQYKNGRRENASSYDYELDRTSYSFSSYENGEKRFDRLVKFRSEGQFRLYAEIDGGNSVFREFNTTTSSSSSEYYAPEWTSISDKNPDQNKRVDMTLRVRRNGSVNYYGGVDFRVEQYKNGRRENASSYDYQLDRTSYYFSSTDNGEVRLNNFVKFSTNGEFRVVAQLREYGTATAYQTFNVNGGTSSNNSTYYSVDNLSIREIYPSSPRTDEWVDLTIRAQDRYNSKVANYEGRVKLLVEEYRNGSWRTASSSDYQLDQQYVNFSRYDNGEKTFSDIVKFRTTGEFRIRAEDDNRSGIYGTKEVRVYSSSSNNNSRSSSYYNFTDKELSKIRAVSNIWNDVIVALERDYPRLRNSMQWRNLSSDFYRNMQDVLRNASSAKFRGWSEFYSAFQEWFSLTIRTR